MLPSRGEPRDPRLRDSCGQTWPKERNWLPRLVAVGAIALGMLIVGTTSQPVVHQIEITFSVPRLPNEARIKVIRFVKVRQ